jgi:hypothetical protein
MGADELEDEGIKLANEIGGSPLVLPAQPLEAGFDIEAGFIHGNISSESTQLYDNRMKREVTGAKFETRKSEIRFSRFPAGRGRAVTFSRLGLSPGIERIP